MIGERPICIECKHYDWFETETLACAAFPKGIPEAILTGDHDHTKPYKGDNGIQFEPKE